MIWDATFQLVLLGSLLIGATSGTLGAFAVLRRRSLLGDALAHAALPGVALAFLWTQSKTLPVLLLGATVSGVVGVLVIEAIVNYTRIKADAALGIVLSVFFGGGIVLLTHIQQSEVGNQSGLDKFLFGQAASIVRSDLYVMCIVSALVMVAVFVFFKEFKGLIFDAEFLSALGFSQRVVDLVLMGLIVLTVMVGLQAVGVILIAAMLITPAAAARFWTDRLHVMVTSVGHFGRVVRCDRRWPERVGTPNPDGAGDGAGCNGCISRFCAGCPQARGARQVDTAEGKCVAGEWSAFFAGVSRVADAGQAGGRVGRSRQRASVAALSRASACKASRARWVGKPAQWRVFADGVGTQRGGFCGQVPSAMGVLSGLSVYFR